MHFDEHGSEIRRFERPAESLENFKFEAFGVYLDQIGLGRFSEIYNRVPGFHSDDSDIGAVGIADDTASSQAQEKVDRFAPASQRNRQDCHILLRGKSFLEPLAALRVGLEGENPPFRSNLLRQLLRILSDKGTNVPGNVPGFGFFDKLSFENFLPFISK